MSVLTKKPLTNHNDSGMHITVPLNHNNLSGELVEKRFIGPVEYINQVNTLMNLLLFHDVSNTVNAEEVIQPLSPGKFLKGYRIRGNLSQQELSEKTNVSVKQIFDMENGKKDIPIDLAKQLAKMLNCDYRQFITSS